MHTYTLLIHMLSNKYSTLAINVTQPELKNINFDSKHGQHRKQPHQRRRWPQKTYPTQRLRHVHRRPSVPRPMEGEYKQPPSPLPPSGFPSTSHISTTNITNPPRTLKINPPQNATSPTGSTWQSCWNGVTSTPCSWQIHTEAMIPMKAVWTTVFDGLHNGR